MSTILKVLNAASALLLVVGSFAQGGVRLVLWNYEPIFDAQGYGNFQHIGVGYDHDLNDRLSFSIQGRTSFDGNTWAVNYHSAYHMADNSSGSAYFGPMVGVRHFTGEAPLNVFPVGIRLGVRGGLERFYADLHGGVQYNIGASSASVLEGSSKSGLAVAAYCIGLDLGWGWDKPGRR